VVGAGRFLLCDERRVRRAFVESIVVRNADALHAAGHVRFVPTPEVGLPILGHEDWNRLAATRGAP
jgi:hypothetical protein